MRLSWEKLVTAECYNDFKKDDPRNYFVRDVDRVTFSNHFKRLMRKTQVHPLTGNDHVHNRLLHSLEVASVGRSIACDVYYWLVDKKELSNKHNVYEFASIVQAACLAHDLGNPPFGHTGESAVKEWFSNKIGIVADIPGKYGDFTLYDGNASSFRIATKLRLTYSSMGAIVKYPWFSKDVRAKEKEKFSFFESDATSAKEVMQKLGCCNDAGFIRHPLSYLMEAADDICYALLDIEDAYELKIVDKNKILDFYKTEGIEQTDVSKARSILISRWISTVTKNFINQYDALMDGESVDITMDVNVENAKMFAERHIYHDERTSKIMVGSYEVYRVLLDAMIGAILDLNKNDKMSAKSKYTLKLMEQAFMPMNFKELDLYEQILLTVDYITGMTDNYIIEIAGYFNGTNKNSVSW